MRKCHRHLALCTWTAERDVTFNMSLHLNATGAGGCQAAPALRIWLHLEPVVQNWSTLHEYFWSRNHRRKSKKVSPLALSVNTLIPEILLWQLSHLISGLAILHTSQISHMSAVLHFVEVHPDYVQPKHVLLFYGCLNEIIAQHHICLTRSPQ